MSGKQYLKNQLPVILINLLGMLAFALFLIASDNPIQTVLFILAVWSIVLVLSLLTFYFSRKKYLNKLLNMTEQLEERYLLPEIMQVPERADEQVFYQIMKMAEKSMLERIGEVQRERREYKEYIEQWIHEVKTPITAMKMLCERILAYTQAGANDSAYAVSLSVGYAVYDPDGADSIQDVFQQADEQMYKMKNKIKK